jgi:hypothetical protein
MTRIFIENQELDLTKDFSQQTTYAVDDLNNVDSKSTSFTKTIVLPGTANNNRLLGNIFEFSNSNFTADIAPNVNYNFNASKSAKARMEINGLQVMKGVLRLLEIIIDGDYIEYEVALFGELGGFYNAMSSRKLTDLDFSEYDHTWNVTNITNSWNGVSGGTGYYYPLIDYGNVSPLSDPDFAKNSYYFTAFRPAFYVRQYMMKIAEQAGYTLESTFMDTAFFKRLIVPNNQNRLQYKSVIQLAANPTRSFGAVSGLETIELKNIQTTTFTTPDDRVFTYTPATTITTGIILSFNGTFAVSAPTDSFPTYGEVFVFLSLVKNGTEVLWDSDKIGGPVSAWGASTAFPMFYNIGMRGESLNVELAQNDTLEIQLNIAGSTGPADSVIDFSINQTNSSIRIFNENQSFIPAAYGDYLIVNGTLPANILQKDFFSSVMKMFNLIAVEDKFTEKKLIIEPYVDFYDTDKSSYLDWSDKIDHSKPIKIKPMSEINSRYYQLGYRSDSDYYNDQYRKKYNEGYADRVFDNQLEFTKDTQKVEVIFSPTPVVKYAGQSKVLPVIYKRNNNAEESTEHNIRILQAKKITGVPTWYIKSATRTNLSSALTSYGYAGHMDNPDNPQADLNFGAPKEIYTTFDTGTLSNNLFNVYYSPYFAEITDKDSRLITCKMKLNEQDIFNLNFGKFIYIDGTLYRLIKISDFTEDDVCQVELLRVINTLY